ncbi:hypothetical protein BDR22DRAFT_887367 [Usnea florida]
MAPGRVFKSQRVQERALARNDESQVEEPFQPGSQSSDDNQVTKLATRMQRESRKRREARRTVIIDSYREAVRKIEHGMTMKFEDITRRMIKRHQLQMNKLNDLIQRRSTIEAKLFASSQNIESAFIYADKALAFAFGRRLQSVGKHQKVPIS